MWLKVVGGVAAFLVLSPAFPRRGTGRESSPIVGKERELGQLLDQMREDIERLRIVVTRSAEEGKAVDIRQTREYQALERRFRALQEELGAPSPRDPAQIWQAMGNPKELAERLDRLIEVVGPTIPEQAGREQFQKDVEALKEEIAREVSEEELYERVGQRLSERITNASNEREKAWLQRQLDALERSDGPDRQVWIDRYIRIENVRVLHEFAKKHSISREQMVKCGLAFMGYRRRPPGQPPGPEPGPHRGGPPRRGPGPPGEGRRR